MKTKRHFCESCNRVINTKDTHSPFRQEAKSFVYLFGRCKGCDTTLCIAKKQRRKNESKQVAG